MEGSIWTRRVLVLALCLAFCGIGLVDIFQNSAVADEIGGHMDSGYQYLKTGIFNGGIANFPLGQIIMALPAVLTGAPRAYFSEDQLALFRLPILLLGLLLAIAVWKFGTALDGSVAGLAALTLVCLSPNILGNSTVATLDLPITLFVFLTIGALWRFTEKPTTARLLVLSLALGCALTTKIQAILLIPMIVIVLGVRVADSTVRPRWSWVFLALIPYLVINLVYLHVPFLSGEILPPMFSRALEIKLAHAQGQLGDLQVAYLCGRYSNAGWWYYFPAAIAFKTPIPTLILLIVGLSRCVSKESALFLLMPVSALLGLAMISSVNIGLRHVLPIYPFLFLIAGKGVSFLFSKGRSARMVLVLLGGAYLSQAILIPPHHLSYFNCAVGGPENGRNFLIDSNLDWGQNDHFLRRFLQKQPPGFQIDPDPFHPLSGRIAVNVNAYYGIYGGGGKWAYYWLKDQKPEAVVAESWLIFDTREDPGASERPPVPMSGPVGSRDLFRIWTLVEEPRIREESIEVLRKHLKALDEKFSDLKDPAFRFPLSRAYIAITSYGDAITSLRQLLGSDPSFRPAVGLGSELMVRWKLGMLRFKGRQYLEAPRASEPPSDDELPDILSLSQAARRYGISELLAGVHQGLAKTLTRHGRMDEVRVQEQLAFSLDPGHS